MTIHYDAAALSGWAGLPRLLCRYRGTIFHGALVGPIFWIAMASHIGFLVVGGRLPINDSKGAPLFVEDELLPPLPFSVGASTSRRRASEGSRPRTGSECR